MHTAWPLGLADAGWTLIEMAVTLVVMAVLLTLALPAYQDWAAGKAVESQIGVLAASFRLARAEAMRLGQWVGVCRMAEVQAHAQSGFLQCASDASANADWAGGWLVFVDRDASKSHDASEPLLQVQTGFSAGARMLVGKDNYVAQFRPDGITAGSSASFVVTKGVAQKKLVLSAQGRLRLE